MQCDVRFFQMFQTTFHYDIPPLIHDCNDFNSEDCTAFYQETLSACFHNYNWGIVNVYLLMIEIVLLSHSISASVSIEVCQLLLKFALSI